MNNIKRLNQLLYEWTITEPENKNKMDEITREIVETRNKIADYPIELINMSKSIKSLRKREKRLDNYIIIEKCLKLFEKYHIKYDKEINLMKPDVDEIIKNMWEIKEKEYSKNPKYDTEEIKRIIGELKGME
jgi:DNA-binding ferritin-like protein (Dps family)